MIYIYIYIGDNVVKRLPERENPSQTSLIRPTVVMSVGQSLSELNGGS